MPMTRVSSHKREKRCPVCGRPVYESDHAFCSMKCSDVDKSRKSTATMKEVEALMQQYRDGNWTSVD